MFKHFKRILNSRGVTLVEMIVAMVVMVVIMISVTTVFAPMLITYQRAGNLAEVNTLFDNISALIMDDVARANEIVTNPADLPPQIIIVPDPDDEDQNFPITPLFRIRTTFWSDYYLDPDGIIWMNAPSLDTPVRILPRDFYKFNGENETVFSVGICTLTEAATEGVFILTLRIVSTDGWFRDRIFSARPIGMN